MDPLISMNQAFIEKLYGILEENYQDENFGVKELASGAGISRSQLHRKLQTLKGMSASKFIRSFRLEKAHTLLENNVSTVSEVSYAVGFNSPSYFIKCFHDHYKCSPGELKSHSSDKFGDGLKERLLPDERSSSVGQRIWVALMATFVAGLVIFNLWYISPKNQPLSLAVLPFRNLSEDPSNQYFSDGIMDMITSQLSHVDGLNVISRTTMEHYRGTTNTIPEISKALNVSYILEGSVQRYADKTQIILQLIDAKEDRHLWSQNYERAYEDIFELQGAIAQDVAKQLKVTIGPNKDRIHQTNAPKNFEAFNTYLKGRFFWHRRTEEDLKKSIYYFEKAVEIDPQYALAYAGLADAYFIMVWWGWYDVETGIAKARKYVDMALNLDSKDASAHATLGGILAWYDWNWEMAEEELKKAVSIDPQYATGHQYYAELLDILGRNREAREQIDLALKYNPNSRVGNSISAMVFYNTGNFKRALEEQTKSAEISGIPDYTFCMKNLMRLDDQEQALNCFKKMESGNEDDMAEIDLLFKNGGMEAVLRAYADRLEFKSGEPYYKLGTLYCMAKNYEKALECLEKSYEARELLMPRMKNNYDFKELRKEPRFLKLVENMGQQKNFEE
ncbi:helix-turn-helix domain-containing protein [Mangrovimonas sp. DI 80]|uniref:helix-turn-helix domain-containing protein n=1 Tax=Mangrovimonas sp. DI 80 TaxID=1779330 RepID=UPI0009F9E462|nr:helix-turn-helix domain-containing protein [Mangrovimonas sp. DI 80]